MGTGELTTLSLHFLVKRKVAEDIEIATYLFRRGFVSQRWSTDERV